MEEGNHHQQQLMSINQDEVNSFGYNSFRNIEHASPNNNVNKHNMESFKDVVPQQPHQNRGKK